MTALAGLSCVIVGPLAGGGTVTAAPQPPNFVVILTDDQSWVGLSLRIDPEDRRTRSDYYQTPQAFSLLSSCRHAHRAVGVDPGRL